MNSSFEDGSAISAIASISAARNGGSAWRFCSAASFMNSRVSSGSAARSCRRPTVSAASVRSFDSVESVNGSTSLAAAVSPILPRARIASKRTLGLRSSFITRTSIGTAARPRRMPMERAALMRMLSLGSWSRACSAGTTVGSTARSGSMTTSAHSSELGLKKLTTRVSDGPMPLSRGR